MKPPLPASILEEGLLYWWPKISELDGIPFFGTLLGLTRHGGPIDGDDDVDFLLPMAVRPKVVELIDNSEFQFAPVNLVPRCDDIIQISKTVENHELLIDFYFYTQDHKERCILKWHFTDARLDPKKFLRFSNALIDSKLTLDFGPERVAFPNQSRQLVAFLYGKKWEKPLAKHVSYEIYIVNGKPKIKVTSKKLLNTLKLKRDLLSDSNGFNRVFLYALILVTISPLKSLELSVKKIKTMLDDFYQFKR